MRRSVAEECDRSRLERSLVSHRSVIALLLACVLVLALGPAQAQAVPKVVIDIFGSSGTGAGQFTTPTGMGVDQDNGDLYVVDSANNRVQKFNAIGMFERAWGYDVDGTEGTGTGFEICLTEMFCKAGVAGPGAGQLSAAQGIAVDQLSGDVYVTNQGNRRVEQYHADGSFVRAWGWDVEAPAPVPPETPAFEVCEGTETCKQGVNGSGPGQFGTSMGHPAVDPRNGQVVVADRTNRRVQKFNGSTGAFVASFGSAGTGVGQFGTNGPTRVAVDSAGSVYTVESTLAPRRVQKFNPDGSAAAVFAPDRTTGTSTTTPPTDVAVDPENDHVVVVKNTQAPPPAPPPEVLEFDLAGEFTDSHAAGAGLPGAGGLAVDGTNGRIYISTSSGQRIFVLGTSTPPSATIAPASAVMATTATLNGTVNPNGGGDLITRYRFEYREEGAADWTRVPETDEEVGNDSSPHNVSEPVTGLEPNTEYQVRLVATRDLAAGTDISAVETFTTLTAPPSITEAGPREVTDTTALLAGRVDPNRLHTTYRFEYGTDTGYGTTTAVDNAGSGATPVPVSKAITGLQPGTTYHFRLVATNAAGEIQGADRTFTTGANPPQPSGRAYEMVSPLDKNGGDVDRDFLNINTANQSGAAASGDAVAFTSRLQFGGVESGAIEPTYVARRTGSGWTTEGVTPPIGNADPTGTERPFVSGLSLDLSKAFVRASPSLTPGAEDLTGSWGLYMRSSGAGERYTLLSDPWTTLEQDPDTTGTFRSFRFEYVADTPDSRHVVFNSQRQLLSDGPVDAGNSPSAVYEWVDGSLRLASVPPPGVSSFDTAQTVVAGDTARGTGGNLPGDNVISGDGRRLFFTAALPGAGRHVFVREDGATTLVVSSSEAPGPPLLPGVNAGFWGAKKTDGSVAFFTSQRPLIEGAETASLYRWDASAPAGARLTELSRDEGGSPSIAGPAAVSDDATGVAFVARGVLASGTSRGEPTRNAPNLYLWRQGEGVRFIKTLVSAQAGSGPDGNLWTPQANLGGRAARISADGERVLFASFAPLTGFDNIEATPEACGDPAEAGDPCRQIYLYDAPSDTLSCLTCVPGVPVTGSANLFGNREAGRPGDPTISAPYRQPRNLSADGTRAFFETARPLVSADRNATLDVYEWADPDLDGEGDLRLISTGRSTTDSKFVDASVTGDNVFFTTRERLVGIDTDNLVDIYDARVGGGIPAQNPAPASSCQGEDCQGALSGAPFLPGVGTGDASHGDARPGPRPSFFVRKLSRAQLARLAQGQPIAVRVRVNRAGRVRLTARANVGKRMRTVAGASKRARRAGTVKLTLKLSRSARRQLARESRLNVRLAVRFAGVREARTSTLRLRRARSSGERSGR